MKATRHLWLRALALLATLAVVAPAGAVEIRITVTNNQPAGGLAVTPFWLGIHDGTFDLFDSGAPASLAIENVAELGETAQLMADFLGQGVDTTLVSGGMAPPFLPGQSNSATLNVADPTTLRYFSYASMVVPTNDLFVANGNPLAFPIFDAAGVPLGPLTIQIFGQNVWDAGTEVNDVLNGGAFVAGVDAMLGTPEGGVVSLFLDDPNAPSYLTSLIGLTTPAGTTITQTFGGDTLLATIRVQAIPEPSTLALAGIGLLGLGGLAGWRRWRMGLAR